MINKKALIYILLLGLLFIASCASRKIAINTLPSGAKVIVDGESRGITPCTFPFTYYGSRQIILEKDGYQTLKAIAPIKPPLIQVFPFDILILLIPYPITDHHTLSYKLQKREKQDVKRVMERGKELKGHLHKRLKQEGYSK